MSFNARFIFLTAHLITVEVVDGNVVINATVTMTDLEVENAVVHVVDAVLTPPVK